MLREGLTTAASQPAAPAPIRDTIALDVSLLLMSYDDNRHPVYKAKGGQHQKFGIRFWPEILPALGVDPASLTCACRLAPACRRCSRHERCGNGAGKPGPNPINLHVLALKGEKGPRKGFGLTK
jgi:hypothetical protein